MKTFSMSPERPENVRYDGLLQQTSDKKLTIHFYLSIVCTHKYLDKNHDNTSSSLIVYILIKLLSLIAFMIIK